MELLLSNPYVYLDTLLLVFIRIMSFFIALPIFSNRNIPNTVKIALSFFLSLIIINVVDVNISVSSAYPIAFLVVAIKEIFIGWILGFSFYIIFSAVILAGLFVDRQIGFGMVNVFDPLSQIQLSITGNLYYYLLLLLLLVTNRHQLFITVIIKCFNYIPIGQVRFDEVVYSLYINTLTDIFLLGLKIAAPFFLSMLVTNVVLGILARTAPQMNLFVIGFPLKIILGLFVLVITIDVFDGVSDMIYMRSMELVDELIQALAPVGQ